MKANQKPQDPETKAKNVISRGFYFVCIGIIIIFIACMVVTKNNSTQINVVLFTVAAILIIFGTFRILAGLRSLLGIFEERLRVEKAEIDESTFQLSKELITPEDSKDKPAAPAAADIPDGAWAKAEAVKARPKRESLELMMKEIFPGIYEKARKLKDGDPAKGKTGITKDRSAAAPGRHISSAEKTAVSPEQFRSQAQPSAGPLQTPTQPSPPSAQPSQSQAQPQRSKVHPKPPQAPVKSSQKTAFDSEQQSRTERAPSSEITASVNGTKSNTPMAQAEKKVTEDFQKKPSLQPSVTAHDISSPQGKAEPPSAAALPPLITFPDFSDSSDIGKLPTLIGLPESPSFKASAPGTSLPPLIEMPKTPETKEARPAPTIRETRRGSDMGDLRRDSGLIRPALVDYSDDPSLVPSFEEEVFGSPHDEHVPTLVDYSAGRESKKTAEIRKTAIPSKDDLFKSLQRIKTGAMEPAASQPPPPPPLERKKGRIEEAVEPHSLITQPIRPSSPETRQIEPSKPRPARAVPIQSVTVESMLMSFIEKLRNVR
jgi:hypothetical protein